MQDRLFVYGSLLSSHRHAMGERLRAEADLIGPARVQARLYRVSWYPCAVLSGVSGEDVHGEVYRLRDAAAALRWLDEYEGMAPGPTGVAASDEYERREVSAMLTNATCVTAWMYLYSRPVVSLERVVSGQWDISEAPSRAT